MSFDAGFMLGLMMGGGTASASGKDIYTVVHDGSGMIINIISNRSDNAFDSHAFYFAIKEFKIITKAVTSKGKSTRTWTKKIITSVTNSLGNIIWTLTPDTSGKITAVYDSNGNEILHGITNGNSVLTDTPEGCALGYALAYSNEQDNLVEEIINAYKEGISDAEEIGTVDDDGAIEDAGVNEMEMQGSGAVFHRSAPYASGKKSITFYCDYIILKRDSSKLYIYCYGSPIRNVTVATGGLVTESNSSNFFTAYSENYEIYGDVRYDDGTQAGDLKSDVDGIEIFDQ